MDFHRRNGPHSSKPKQEKLPCLSAVLFVAYIGLIVGLSFIPFFNLPDNLNTPTFPERFDGLQARDDLFDLVYYGPRPLGSIANEISAIDYLSSQIKKISSESIGRYKIEMDIQDASGHYSRYGRLNIYESIQNVIVKLTPKDGNHSNALLINSHFDSVIGSPGAGDDGSMVAVMLGILKSLTKSKSTVKHPIVFLFNGNEEQGLEASHAFITQHRWARDVRIFINLDGMGVGGKEILFRSGPQNAWLLSYYGKAAKHPFASVFGEELFENNFLPGDTDFTVFRDYGKLIGLDFAYIKNGYAYHTKLDQFSSVDEGTLQHTGDNILALTRVLANADELNEKVKFKTDEKAVYYDVLGLFFISYSEKTGTLINYSICGIALLLIGVSIWFTHRATTVPLCEVLWQFMLSFGIYLGSVSTAAGLVFLLAYLIDWVGYSMAWFSQPWLIFGLYFCPFIFVMTIIPTLILELRSFRILPLNFGVLLFMHCNCIVMVALTLALTVLHIRSAFLITNVIIFYLLALIINVVSGFYRKPHLWILPIVICQSIPIIFNSYIMDIVYSVYIPVTGRQTDNPELMIAFCAIGLCLLIFGFIIPIFSIFREAKKIISINLLIFVTFFILIFASYNCFPYTKETPQRNIVSHVARKIHDSSGKLFHEDYIFLMYRIDRHSLETLEDVAAVNGEELYSAQQDNSELQFYSDQHRWIRAPPLRFSNPAKLTLLSKKKLKSKSLFQYSFTISNPTMFRVSMTMTPLNNASFEAWSFGTEIKETLLDAKDKYVVWLQFGKETAPYTFSLTLKIPNMQQEALLIGLEARYLDESFLYGSEMGKFIHSFPEWTTVTGTLATYDAYYF